MRILDKNDIQNNFDFDKAVEAIRMAYIFASTDNASITPVGHLSFPDNNGDFDNPSDLMRKSISDFLPKTWKVNSKLMVLTLDEGPKSATINDYSGHWWGHNHYLIIEAEFDTPPVHTKSFPFLPGPETVVGREKQMQFSSSCFAHPRIPSDSKMSIVWDKNDRNLSMMEQQLIGL